MDVVLLEAIRKDLNAKRMLYEITAGLEHLHALKIVHRDIKPQNVLIKQTKSGFQVAISDFGLCKRLSDEQSSFFHTTVHNAGTIGWRAPESIQAAAGSKASTWGEQGATNSSDNASPTESPTESPYKEMVANNYVASTGDSVVPVALQPLAVSKTQESSTDVSTLDKTTSSETLMRITKAVDIFSAGLVFFFYLTNGDHPFGDRFTREWNMIHGKPTLTVLEWRFPVAHDMIARMLQKDPRLRPTASDVRKHPFFWPAARQLLFLQDVSDRVDSEERDSPLVQELEQCASELVGEEGWQKKVHRGLYENLGKYRRYDTRRFRDLLRAIRNKVSDRGVDDI